MLMDVFPPSYFFRFEESLKWKSFISSESKDVPKNNPTQKKLLSKVLSQKNN